MGRAARTIAIWSPDWPVVTVAAAAGLDPAAPAAVLASGRVLACTASAREAGVRRGLRRREAQYRCPNLAILARDLAEESRAFEPIVVAVESLAPGVEIVRPGLCTVSARGPARYFGGDEAAAARLADEASAAGPGDLCRAGVAEGAFAAALAARVGRIVPAGQTPEFLAPYPVDVLDRPDLADLLRRLGLRTLGDFAGLPPADVTARFGADGGFAHRLARGEDPLPPDGRTPPPDLVVTTHLDPPAEQVERAAFAARPLADQLHARLTAVGLGCTRLVVEAETETGERYERIWRYEGVLDAAAIAERVRWQLDGWLTASQSRAGQVKHRPRGGIAVLRLAPDEVIPHGGDQLGFWTHGADAEAAERAGRALARVQGMLGQPAVLTAVLAGGRGPGERIRYVAWGDPRGPLEREAEETGPWPGRIPAPSPALVPPSPVPAQLVDDGGLPVAISSRYAISAPPARLRVGEESPRPVLSWAGPWPAEERWWDSARADGTAAAVKVRVQVATADGTGWLLISQGGRWFVEAVYD